MHGTLGNANKCGDVAVQVEQSMHLDSGFVLPEFGPREQGKTQVDGGGIQRIQTLVELHADGIVSVKRSRDADQNLREVREDSPVATFVGVSQGGASDCAAEASVVEFAA